MRVFDFFIELAKHRSLHSPQVISCCRYDAQQCQYHQYRQCLVCVCKHQKLGNETAHGRKAKGGHETCKHKECKFWHLCCQTAKFVDDTCACIVLNYTTRHEQYACDKPVCCLLYTSPSPR